MMQPAVVQWHNEALGNVDDFLRDNDKFVWHIARKFQSSGYKVGVDLEELHHIAQFGMLKAYQTFNKDAGIKWQTYGARVMTNEILMAFRRTKKTSLDVSIEAALSVDEQGNTLAIADTLHGASDVDISASWFWEYANTLSERDRLIIQLRLNGLKEYEISERLGITQSFVSRILRRIQRDYERGEWKVTQIQMTKEEYLAERLAGKNRSQIANDLGLKHQAYLYPQLEKWGIKDKEAERTALAEFAGPVRMQTAMTVEPKTQEPPKIVAVEPIKPEEPKVKQPTSGGVLERLEMLRNKFSECISELAEIEKEVRPLLEAKNEMSEVAKRLLELVG